MLALSYRLLLLFGPFVVCVPVQTSPPAMKRLPLCGSSTCELQKMSVPVELSSVKWPASGAPVLSQMSYFACPVCWPFRSEP